VGRAPHRPAEWDPEFRPQLGELRFGEWVTDRPGGGAAHGVPATSRE